LSVKSRTPFQCFGNNCNPHSYLGLMTRLGSYANIFFEVPPLNTPSRVNALGRFVDIGCTSAPIRSLKRSQGACPSPAPGRGSEPPTSRPEPAPDGSVPQCVDWEPLPTLSPVTQRVGFRGEWGFSPLCSPSSSSEFFQLCIFDSSKFK